MSRLGIAIPTYERDHMLAESFRDVLPDSRVASVAITDDASSSVVRERVLGMERDPKVNVHLNHQNLGCYLNKHLAVLFSMEEYVILLDSDNTIQSKYLDALDAVGPWSERVLYMPVFARPVHDYRAYEGQIVTRDNVKYLVDRPRFLTALNTGNFFVNRRAYLEVFDTAADPMAADSIYFVYCWLRSGRVLQFVPNLVYNHRIHGGSNYVAYAERTKPFMEALEHRLRMGEWI